MLQFLTGWKSSISTMLKNSSSAEQGAPNRWSRCWCWSRGSKRDVIVSNACDRNCHSACNAGVNKSKVRLWLPGHFCLFLSRCLKNGADTRQSVPSFRISQLQAPWAGVVPGVACSKEERNGCNCKNPSFSVKTFPGEREQRSLVPLHLPALSIPSLKSLNLCSGSKGDPKRYSPHVDIYRWKTLPLTKRSRILIWKWNSWFGRVYRSSAFQCHFCSKHFKH